MGGCRCSYKNCTNTTKKTENIHFFHYPVKQKERCKIWIQKAEKPHFFDLDEYQLRNKMICEIHFKDEYFLNSQKNRLLRNAIPTIDGEELLEAQTTAEHVPEMTKTIKSEDNFKQFSAKLDDVEILPANDDGTLFILNTVPSYEPSKNMKSYILKNDYLLPLTEDSKNRIKTEQVDYFSDAEINNEFILNHSDKQRMPIDKATTLNEKLSADLGPQTNNISKELLESMICKTIEEKYLPQLKQHSKTLRQIKKVRNFPKPRPNRKAVLRYLKLRLPPTLYNLVNLSIDDDYELTEEDKSFFKNLHFSSPAAYNFLMQDCNWRMPFIEICEGDPNTMDDT